MLLGEIGSLFDGFVLGYALASTIAFMGLNYWDFLAESKERQKKLELTQKATEKGILTPQGIRQEAITNILVENAKKAAEEVTDNVLNEPSVRKS